MNPERLREIESDLEKAVEQGRRYLESEHKNGYFTSYISASRDFSQPSQISPRETFSTIVIADIALKDDSDSETARAALQYIETQRQQGQFTFFEDRKAYPPDTDTNSLGVFCFARIWTINSRRSKSYARFNFRTSRRKWIGASLAFK